MGEKSANESSVWMRYRCKEKRTVVVDGVADEEEGGERGDDGSAATVVRHTLTLPCISPYRDDSP